MPDDTYALLDAWRSNAGAGPTLRGRRRDGATTIHFLSGTGFCGGVYWPLLRRFLPDYGIFTHDIEGHGDSDAPARYSGTGAVIERIPQVMREQGLCDQRLIGMGHSFGGALTIAVAARHPRLFKALILLDPILPPPILWLGFRAAAKLGRHPMVSGARRRRDAWASRDEALSRLRGRGIYQGWSEEALECFVDYATHERDGARVLSCPREIEAEVFGQPVYAWRALRKIEVPILFLRGAGSYGFFPASERLAQRVNPRVTLRSVTGGHCFMQEHPQTAHDAVRAFLSTISL